MPEELDIHLRRRQRAAQSGTRSRLPANLRQLGAVGHVTQPGGTGRQPVIVQVHSRKGSGTRQQLAYLQFEKGPHQTQAPLYGPGANEQRTFIRAAQHDPFQYRLFVSPASPGLTDQQRTQFVEALVRQMEQDVGRQLDWVAANHYDRPHPHTHLVVRGVANGETWYMSRHYFEQGIRHRAERLLTMMLGQVQQQGPQLQLTQRYAQERLAMDGMLRGVADPDVLRVTRTQAQYGTPVTYPLTIPRHDAGGGAAMQVQLQQLQQRTQALQEAQRQQQGGWRHGR